MLVGSGAHEPAVGGHELGGDQVVAGQAVSALEPARAAAEREPGDAGRRHPPAGGGQTVRLRRPVDLCPNGAAADARDAPLGVHDDVGHAADVEDHAVVASDQPATECPPPRTAMGRPRWRAKASAAMTSSGAAQRATKAGRRSIIALLRAQASA